MIRDSATVRHSGFQPIDGGVKDKGKDKLSESGPRQLDSSGPRTGLGGGSGSKVSGGPRLGSDQYVDRHGQPQPRSVQPLSYGLSSLRHDAGNGTTLGSIKNKLASLPFVGKTTYGRVQDGLKAYEGAAKGLTPDQKKAQLGPLKQQVEAWLANPKHVAGPTGTPSAKETAMRSLLGAVNAAIDEADFDKANPALASRHDAMAKAGAEFAGVIKQSGELTGKTIFRANSDTTKALAKHLLDHTPSDYRTGLTSEAVATAKLVAGASEHPINAINFRDLKPEQMTAALKGASHLMSGVMGGTTKKGVADAAAALPQELVDTLKDLDAEVRKAGGDDKARYNAFVGTLFLRHAVPIMQFLKDGEGSEAALKGMSKSEEKALGLMATAMQYAANQSSEASWGSKVPDQFKDQFRDFMTQHQQPMQDFMQAVLSR